MTTAINDLHSQMITWLEQNPVSLHGDHSVSIPTPIAAKILEGNLDDFYEFETDLINSNACNIDWSSLAQDFYDHFSDRVDFNLDEDEVENDPSLWTTDLKNLFEENKQIDGSDLINSALSNTTLYITCTPVDEFGDPFVFPHDDFDKEENARLCQILKNTFGIENPWNAEPTYSSEILKICGTIDLKSLRDNGTPNIITIGPKDNDNVLTHDPMQGSWNGGSIEIAKTVTLTATFKPDVAYHYGVNSIYGNSYGFWSHDLDAQWQQTAFTNANNDPMNFENKSISEKDNTICGLNMPQAIATNNGINSVAAVMERDSVANVRSLRSVAVTTEFGSNASSSGEASIAAAAGMKNAANTKGMDSIAAATGRHSMASTQNRNSIAAASLDRSKTFAHNHNSVAVTLSYDCNATIEGYNSVALVTGENSRAHAMGENGIAIATARHSSVRGKKGNALVLVEHDSVGNIKTTWAGIVGHDNILPNVDYVLVNGIPEIARPQTDPSAISKDDDVRISIINEPQGWLDDVTGFVEATPYEQQKLSEDLAPRGPSSIISPGRTFQVGVIAGHPVCIAVTKFQISNNLIVFVEPSSRIVDHNLIKEWLKRWAPKTAFNNSKLKYVGAENITNILDWN